MQKHVLWGFQKVKHKGWQTITFPEQPKLGRLNETNHVIQMIN